LSTIKGTIHEDQYIFMIISRSLLRKMRNISDKNCREKHIFFFQKSFFFENRGFSEVMWKNSVETGRPQMKIWRMNFACSIPKAH